MASDIFIVRVTPAKGKKTGVTFPWIVVKTLIAAAEIHVPNSRSEKVDTRNA